ncbi:hypothetical protein GCM10010167_94440 [Paractinoplanes deccanensis]
MGCLGCGCWVVVEVGGLGGARATPLDLRRAATPWRPVLRAACAAAVWAWAVGGLGGGRPVLRAACAAAVWAWAVGGLGGSGGGRFGRWAVWAVGGLRGGRSALVMAAGFGWTF